MDNKQRPMTFQEFQSSAITVKLETVQDELLFEANSLDENFIAHQSVEYLAHLHHLTHCKLISQVFVYADVLVVEEYHGHFHTIIGPDAHTSDNLARLELLLYRNAYLLELAI